MLIALFERAVGFYASLIEPIQNRGARVCLDTSGAAPPGNVRGQQKALTPSANGVVSSS